VRARICSVSQLRAYTWSSYALSTRPNRRPRWILFAACLESAGDLVDKGAGWERYEKYLDWLSEEPARKQMAFDQMSRGWAIGTKGFCRAVVGDEKDRVRYKLNHAELREARELVWESEAARLLTILHISKEATVSSRNSAPWKIPVATFLKDRSGASNDWIARRIGMGSPLAVSR
jgi:putative transposase